MSRDGLLWKWVGKIHPKFCTPWLSNIVVGLMVAFLPAFFTITMLGELVSMGTLLAFAIVCAGFGSCVAVSPNAARPFRTPLGAAGADYGNPYLAVADGFVGRRRRRLASSAGSSSGW